MHEGRKRKCSRQPPGVVVRIGDCVEVMRRDMPSDSVHLIVTSPPYAANKRYEKDICMNRAAYAKFTEAWIAEANRVLLPGHNMFVNIGYWSGSRKNRFFLPEVVIGAARDAGMRFSGWINWVKDKDGLTQTRGCGWGDTYSTAPFFMNGSEPILHFRKEGKQKHRDNKHDEWMRLVREPWIMKPKNMNSVHDAVFPEELPRRCVVMCTLAGDTVLDPFAGTGTVGTVCAKLDRRCTLIDKESKHLERFRQQP